MPETSAEIVTTEQPPAPLAQRVERMEWESKLELVKTLCCKPKAREASPEEFELFCYTARRRGLDPLTKQIYAVYRKTKVDGKEVEQMTIQTGIDGFRLIALRSGKYRGRTSYQFCGPDGEWRDVWTDFANPPVAARVGVYVAGYTEAVWGLAHYREFAQGFWGNEGFKPSGQWGKMECHMLAKCAEALALRSALPEDLGGLYTDDEMAQADNPPPAAPPPSNRAVAKKPEEPLGEPGFTTKDVDTLLRNWSQVQAEDLPDVRKKLRKKLGLTGAVDAAGLRLMAETLTRFVDEGVPLSALD